MKITLFLDFDGVLHPEGELPASKEFSNLPLLMDAIRPFLKKKELEIVLSTSWRDSHSLEYIKNRVGPELSKYIVGSTPSLQNAFAPGGRQKEIEAWLKKHRNERQRWLALDDRLKLFEKNENRLIWCNPDTGLNEQTKNQLVSKINDFLVI